MATTTPDSAKCGLDAPTIRHTKMDEAIIEAMRNFQANTPNRRALWKRVYGMLRPNAPPVRTKPLQNEISWKCDRSGVNREVSFVEWRGSGTYGAVCLVLLLVPPSVASSSRAQPTQPVYIALKHISTKPYEGPPRPDAPATTQLQRVRESFRDAQIEGAVSFLLTSLVLEDSCPNFVMQYGMCFEPDMRVPGGSFTDLFQEIADTDLDRLTRSRHNGWLTSSGRNRDIERRWLCVTFGVFAGMLWMGRYFDLIHNDLFMRNILCNRIPPETHYSYRIQYQNGDASRDFRVPTLGWLPKIGDMGFATSDWLATQGALAGTQIGGHARVSRSGTPSAVANVPTAFQWEADLSAVGAPAFREPKHPLDVSYLPPFARDAWTVLGSVKGRAPPAVSAWAANALDTMRTQIINGSGSTIGRPFANGKQGTAFNDVEQLVEYTVEIFSPASISSAGLADPFLTQKQFDALPLTSIQTFDLPIMLGQLVG